MQNYSNIGLSFRYVENADGFATWSIKQYRNFWVIKKPENGQKKMC